MTRFDPARLKADSYGFTTAVQTRFQDLDPLGHINNVAMAGIFEAGRGRFNWSFMGEHNRKANPGIRWLIARADISYLAEAHFPADVVVASAIGRVGTTSWTILSGAFQGEHCVALCDTVLVYTNEDGPAAIPETLRLLLSDRLFPAG